MWIMETKVVHNYEQIFLCYLFTTSLYGSSFPSKKKKKKRKKRKFSSLWKRKENPDKMCEKWIFSQMGFTPQVDEIYTCAECRYETCRLFENYLRFSVRNLWREITLSLITGIMSKFSTKSPFLKCLALCFNYFWWYDNFLDSCLQKK